ncbi:MAG TPA: hypothetical protein VL361_27375 [Candidatus Limnocylindrales bacterium]|nr:hypothetical protein [Candidatus Limnocylindrales bacterium]
MAAKSRNHRATTATSEATRPLNAMANQARHNYEQAVRTGQRFQEEAGQWWTRVLGQAMTAADWQRQFARLTAISSNAMPLAQKRLEETMQLMEKTGRTSAELMRKALDAVQTAGVAESQAKWMDFWSSSMKAVQSNVEAITELNTHTIDSWIDFVRKNAEVAQTAKAA